MNKNCIVSFANQRGRYVQNMARLSESLRDNFTGGDFVGFVNESSLGCPLHEENPYTFKVYAIKKCIESGYENILYLDTSAFAIKNVNPIFEEIERTGFIFQEAGHLCGNWASDKVLEYHGITRDEAMNMIMVGNAGFMGFSTIQSKPMQWFDEWKRSMEAGMFQGKWDNKEKTESEDERCFGSRHDMINNSIILNKMHYIEFAKKGDEILQYAGVFDEVANNSIILKAQG